LNKPLLLLLLILGLTIPGFSVDYGAVTTQRIDGENRGHTYTGTAAPWLSLNLGESWDLYFSAGFTLAYEGKEWQSLPELYRFGAQFRPFPGMLLELGRHQYRDIRGAVASGLFDGVSLSLNPGLGRLSARFLYTGLLYKKTADIMMTSREQAAYYTPVSYAGGQAFMDTYFAPRRLIGAVAWELPDLGGQNSLALEGIGQGDVNGGEEQLHSAYISARFSRAFREDLALVLGGTLALVKETDKAPAPGLSGSGELAWNPPAGLWDRFSLLVRYTSGEAGTATASFPAITTVSQGYVLNIRPAGLAVVQGSYRARLFQGFSGELTAAYFFRTGDTSAGGAFDATVQNKDSPFLGGELRTSFVWVPFSDLSISLDCGLFIPQWGNYFTVKSSLPWRATGGLVFSF
jgi:hypothetical protein